MYKKEIMQQEKEDAEFLKNYYKHKKNKEGAPMVATKDLEVDEDGAIVFPEENPDEEPIELDSDEEAPQKPK